MGFGKILIKNSDFVVGGIGMVGSLVAAKLCEAGKIKFKNKEQEEKFLFWLGGSSALSGALIGSGLGRVLQGHLMNKEQIFYVVRTDDMVNLGYHFPKLPGANIAAGFTKEKALKIANDIIETANEIV